MKLKDRLMKLSSVDSQWGIWADAPFTAESESRVGQIQFENGGLLDDKEFVGRLDIFNFDVCEIRLAWSEIRDGAAYGIDAIALSGDPHISGQNLIDMIEEEIEDDVDLIASAEDIEAWVEAADEGNNLDVAEGPGILYHLEYESFDLETEIEEAIAEAEENRQDSIL